MQLLLPISLVGIRFLVVLAGVVLPGLRRTDGDAPTPPAKQAEPAAPKAAADANDAAPAVTKVWPEGATLKGRVLDHRGAPIANAEVLMLGEERIIVEADRRTWFVFGKKLSSPPSVRTDKDGAFTITRKQGTANRLAVIAEDPLFWVVSRNSLTHDGNLELKLPESGSLAVHCNLPDKPSKQLVNIERINNNRDSDVLRFHFASCSVPNPGDRVFEHLPPGRYTLQCFFEPRKDDKSRTISAADLQLADVTPSARAVGSLRAKAGPSTYRSCTGSGGRRFARGDGHNSYLGPGRGTPRQAVATLHRLRDGARSPPTADLRSSPFRQETTVCTFLPFAHRHLDCRLNRRTSPVDWCLPYRKKAICPKSRLSPRRIAPQIYPKSLIFASASSMKKASRCRSYRPWSIRWMKGMDRGSMAVPAWSSLAELGRIAVRPLSCWCEPMATRRRSRGLWARSATS